MFINPPSPAHVPLAVADSGVDWCMN